MTISSAPSVMADIVVPPPTPPPRVPSYVMTGVLPFVALAVVAIIVLLFVARRARPLKSGAAGSADKS
jgi:hypothetical protein